MFQIILVIILLLPFIAIAKTISEQSGIPTFVVMFYGFWWLHAIFALFSGGFITATKLFFIPFVIHIVFLMIIALYSWTLDTLSKD